MRLAICMTSYGRLPELFRQIYAMLDQTYENKHLFVAVKGYTERFFRKVILPPMQHFIDEGVLTLRLFPNSNQLANFVDTVRGLDISEFDLFCKIDDDDFYDRDYLKIIVEGLDQYPPGTSAALIENAIGIEKTGDTYKLTPYRLPTGAQGSSLCISPNVMKRIVNAAENPAVLRKEMVLWKGGGSNPKVGWAEDRWFAWMIDQEGCMYYNTMFEKLGKIPVFIGSFASYHSVCRSNLTFTDFGKKVAKGENLSMDYVATSDGVFSIFDGEVNQEGGSLKGKLITRHGDTLVIDIQNEQKFRVYRWDEQNAVYNIEK